MENANVIDQEQLENLHADVSATSNGLISVNSNLFGEEFSADVDRVIKRIALTQGFVKSVINGVHKNAILQGPPGLGKSYVVAEVLRAAGITLGVHYPEPIVCHDEARKEALLYFQNLPKEKSK